MDDLVLPGTIRDLLRVCSLVAVVSGAFAGRRGIVIDLEPGARHAVVAMQADAQHDASVEWLPLADLALDLTDATGRAHAAWWLASAVGLHSPTTSRWLPGASVWTIECDAQSTPWVRAFTPSGSLWSGERVPALTGISPHDPRVLPDGSRWAEAEALRVVVLHVAGVLYG